MADDLKDTDIRSAHEVIRLWPNGAPDNLPPTPPESAYVVPAGVAAGTTMLRNVSDPTLTVYRPAPGEANGVGVVVCPGGGWRFLAWGHEGLDLAAWLAARGYTAFLLKYRVMATPADEAAFFAAMVDMENQLASSIPGAQAPRALKEIAGDDLSKLAREIAADDGRRAVAIVRERASEWDVKPGAVGMIGFSAGAFLVTDVAVDPRAAPLAFVAPIYGGETSGRPVPADAPPLFTVIAHDDRLLFRMVEGLYADWTDADRSAELHIFSRGAHGFGMVRQGVPSDRWIELFEAWLADQSHG